MTAYPRYALVLALVATAGCAQQETTLTRPEVDPLIKACLDQRLNAALTAAPTSRDRTQVMTERLEGALSACGANDMQRSLYLTYTNVSLGVTPDSTGDDALAEGREVLDLVGLKRQGTIRELYANNRVVVSWSDGASESTVDVANVTVRVRSRAGLQNQIEAIDRVTRRRATVQAVYANRAVIVRWAGTDVNDTVADARALAPRVKCLKLCDAEEVMDAATSRRGTIRAVFANGAVFVLWRGDTTEESTTVHALASRIGRSRS